MQHPQNSHGRRSPMLFSMKRMASVPKCVWKCFSFSPVIGLPMHQCMLFTKAFTAFVFGQWKSPLLAAQITELGWLCSLLQCNVQKQNKTPSIYNRNILYLSHRVSHSLDISNKMELKSLVLFWSFQLHFIKECCSPYRLWLAFI